MPPSRNSRPGQERGFALLTVIVIVMALTILGISLFSLSGFEARFFRPAMDQAQAVQSGRAGVDWARYVLESTDDLDSVRLADPPTELGITGIIARRGADFDTADSTGFVFPTGGGAGEPIWVRAVAGQGNQESAVLARFTPSAGQNIYKRLITVMDRIEVFDEGDRFGNMLLYGDVRMGTVRVEDYDNNILSPTAVNSCVEQLPPFFPRPEVDLEGQWWQDRYVDALPLSPGGTIEIGSDEDPRVYRTHIVGEVDDGGRQWSAKLGTGETTILARGISVWLFPQGLRCEDQLRIQLAPGATEATVILVARPGPGPETAREADVGIALLGGIQAPLGVNVFMISNGGVEIEHWLAAQTTGGSVNYLSIYADWARFMGPDGTAAGADMALFHGTGCNPPGVDQDKKDDVVDRLIKRDLLPNSHFARRKLAFVPGSWNENPTPVGN